HTTRNMSQSICAVLAQSRSRGGATARCSTRRSQGERISGSCRWIVPSAALRRLRSSPGGNDRRRLHYLKIPNRPPDCGGGGGGGGCCCWNCGCGGGEERWTCFGGRLAGGGGGGAGA